MAKLDELKALQSELRSGVDAKDDASFGRVIRKGLEFTQTTDADFAESVGVSRPTATRWKNGASVPHAALRPTIYGVVKKLVDHAVRQSGDKSDWAYVGSWVGCHIKTGSTAEADDIRRRLDVAMSMLEACVQPSPKQAPRKKAAKKTRRRLVQKKSKRTVK